MDYFTYHRGELRVEDVAIQDIAEKHGTPVYVYSGRTILEHYRKLRDAFAGGELKPEPLICYSVKANSNLSILKLMKDEGSGFDVVSGGELYRALKVGADPKKIVFAGVGKNDEEITYALEKGILLFNVESEEELANIDRIAGKVGRKAPILAPPRRTTDTRLRHGDAPRPESGPDVRPLVSSPRSPCGPGTRGMHPWPGRRA